MGVKKVLHDHAGQLRILFPWWENTVKVALGYENSRFIDGAPHGYQVMECTIDDFREIDKIFNVDRFFKGTQLFKPGWVGKVVQGYHGSDARCKQFLAQLSVMVQCLFIDIAEFRFDSAPFHGEAVMADTKLFHEFDVFRITVPVVRSQARSLAIVYPGIAIFIHG